MASSVRPIAAIGAPGSRNTVRPAPIRTVPQWQSPVPRPASYNISPIGSHGHTHSVGRVPPSPAFYRPPPEYPGSVQPIRARPSEFRQIPGSTLPAHISSSLRGLPPNTPQCILRNWYVCVDAAKMAVTVSGSFTKANGVTVARHSSPIDIAIDSRVLAAASRTVYQLVDVPDLEMMRARGFPEHLIPSFAEGFPRNWRQLIDEYLGAPTGAQRGIGSGVHRGGDMSARPLHLPLAPGALHEEHRHAGRTGGRFQPIAEDGAASASISPISPPSSVGVGGCAPARQHSAPRVTAMDPPSGARASVYRSGRDIFASSRFSRAGPPPGAARAEERRPSIPLQQRANSQATDVSESTEQHDESGTASKPALSETNGICGALLPAEHVGARIARPSNAALDTPTKQPARARSPSLSPELGMSQDFRWDSAHGHSSRVDEELEPFKFASGADEESLDDADADLTEAARILAIDLPASTQTASKATWKVVDSSDESPVATDSDSNSAQLDVPAGVNNVPAVKAVSVSRVARKAPLSNSTPARAKGKAGKTPKSAPVLLARGKKAAVSAGKRAAKQGPRQQSGAVEDSTPTKEPARGTASKRRSEQELEPVVIIEYVSKRKDGSGSRAKPAESTTEDSEAVPWWQITPSDQSGSEGGGAGGQPGPATSARRAKKTKVAASAQTTPAKKTPIDKTPVKKTPIDKTPAKKTPTDNTTPTKPTSAQKWKLGSQSFHYKQPKALPSVTRSGRKVRRPQEWWTNAQEHLGNTHKESDIKYRWGTGDAVIEKDGKRYRLEDVVLENENAKPLQSSSRESDADGARLTDNTSSGAQDLSER
ncbi:hypothetical protein GGF43_001367 [Coemansia sp. RSA 2618]|nr:hypothetical protein GGF43_001367 [Coemansia sp. RSA 2618]